MLRKTQRRAWKALRGVGRLRRPLRRPHSARRGPRECPPWRLGGGRVCLRSGLRAALGGGEGESAISAQGSAQATAQTHPALPEPPLGAPAVPSGLNAASGAGGASV